MNRLSIVARPSKNWKDVIGVSQNFSRHSSSHVTNCVESHSINSRRRMIGQKIGLPFLIPIAIEHLDKAPLVDAYYYPGDLLSAVLNVEESFWTANPGLFHRACEIVRKARDLLVTLDEVDGATVRKVLEDASSAFKEI